MILPLFLISIIMVFIIDYSGFVDEISETITKILHSPFKIHIPKPFSCSLCMTFWTGLIYLFFNNGFSLINVSYLCLFSALTILELAVFTLIKSLIEKIIFKINNLL